MFFDSCLPPVKENQENRKEQNLKTNKRNRDLLKTKEICIDTFSISRAFIKNLKKKYKSVKVQDTNIIVDSKRKIKFPSVLPFNQVVKYVGKEGKTTYELDLERINLSDIIFKFYQLKNDSIIKQKTDTIVFYPFRHGSIEVKHGYKCSGLKYGKDTEQTSFRIFIEGINADYATFSYKTNYYKQFGSIVNVPTLKREGVEEPYAKYLSSIIHSLSNLNNYNYLSSNESYKAKFNNLHSEIQALLNEIKEKSLVQKVIQDTLIIDLALYYELDSVLSMLREFGFIERIRVSENTEQSVPIKDFPGIHGLVYISFNGEVESDRFERFNMQNKPDYNDYIPGQVEYTYFQDTTNIKIYQNMSIAVLIDGGFENSSSIITVWQKREEHYDLKYILNRIIRESIGGVGIDTIFSFDKQRSIIIGTSSGGDGGYFWGSFWIGVWTLPRTLNIVYRLRVSGDESEYTKFDYFFIENNKLKINKTRVVPYEKDGEYVELSTLIETFNISIDSIAFEKDIGVDDN